MKLTAHDYNDIREACQHLARCWDALDRIDSRHPGLPALAVKDIQALVGLVGERTTIIDYSTLKLTDEAVRKHLQGGTAPTPEHRDTLAKAAEKGPAPRI